jgi:PAS domain S-box-containing protein
MDKSISESLFAAVDSLQDEGIAILDDDGKYIYLNTVHASIYGYEPTELIGESWATLYSEDNVAYIGENIMPKLFERGRWESTLTGKKKDGTSISCRVALTTLDEGLFCICKDVTLENELIEKERHDMVQKVIKIFSSD